MCCGWFPEDFDKQLAVYLLVGPDKANLIQFSVFHCPVDPIVQRNEIKEKIFYCYFNRRTDRLFSSSSRLHIEVWGSLHSEGACYAH